MSTLIMFSPEWTAKARRAAVLLEAALADHDNKAAIATAAESLEKLGGTVPVRRILYLKK